MDSETAGQVALFPSWLRLLLVLFVAARFRLGLEFSFLELDGGFSLAPLRIELLDSWGYLDGRGQFFGLDLFNTLSVICIGRILCCLLYTSPSPRDGLLSRMPSS